jgi:hypothetical protein
MRYADGQVDVWRTQQLDVWRTQQLYACNSLPLLSTCMCGMARTVGVEKLMACHAQGQSINSKLSI